MTSSRPTILITGAAGFIGYHLASYYLHQSCRVIGVDNYLTGQEKNTADLLKEFPEYYSFLNHDVSTPWNQIAARLPPEVDFIFHLASPASVKSYQRYPLETIKANTLGLQNTLDFAQSRQARVIFSSTSEIYGSPLNSPQKESDWGYVNPYGPRSCYDESKRLGEALIYTYNQIFKAKHGIVRIFNTYGPRQHPEDDRVINSFLRSLRHSGDLLIYGDGKQTRSFCYIDDLVTGLDLYAKSAICTPLNLGNDAEITIGELADIVLKISANNSKLAYAPALQDEPVKRKPDLSQAKKLLGFENKVSLQEGLRLTLDSL